MQNKRTILQKCKTKSRKRKHNGKMKEQQKLFAKSKIEKCKMRTILQNEK